MAVSDTSFGRAPEIGTFDRVGSVLGSTLAGFLPPTHAEKNNALVLTDYLENRTKFPGGVHDQLMEIYDHQKKISQENGSNRAQASILAGLSVRSVVNQYGDYLANARSSYRMISLAGRLIADTDNPNLTMKTVLETDDLQQRLALMAPLVRHVEQRRFMQDNNFRIMLDIDPFTTIENRSNPRPGANKRIEDIYTGENDRVLTDRIKEFMEHKIGDMRKPAEDALADQLRRGKFWNTALRGVRGVFSEAAKSALEDGKKSFTGEIVQPLYK